MYLSYGIIVKVKYNKLYGKNYLYGVIILDLVEDDLELVIRGVLFVLLIFWLRIFIVFVFKDSCVSIFFIVISVYLLVWIIEIGRVFWNC